MVSEVTARRELIPSVEHRQHYYLNNWAEALHQPTRQKEYQRRGFKSAGYAQRLLAAHGSINNLFRLSRHRKTAAAYWAARDQAFQTWQRVTCAQRAA